MTDLYEKTYKTEKNESSYEREPTKPEEKLDEKEEYERKLERIAIEILMEEYKDF